MSFTLAVMVDQTLLAGPATSSSLAWEVNFKITFKISDMLLNLNLNV